ncbi:MAG: glucose-6-phosphate dehydrogenase assembly protein OpcA [Actinomycetota bacterium]
MTAGGREATAAPAARWEGRDVSLEEVVRRLGELRDHATHGAARGRTAVLNLVVWAPSGGPPAEAPEMLGRLVGPSRVVIVAQDGGGAGIDARVEVFTRPGPVPDSVVCEELVSLTLGGEVAAHAASAVTPLVHSDLPTVLWWPCAPEPERPAYRELAGAADRVVLEAAASVPGPRAVALLAGEVAERAAVVTDLAWAALTPWRQLVAQIVGPELALTLRAGPSSLRVVHGGPEPTLQALLLAGWLRDVLGEALSVRLEAAAGEAEVGGVELVGPHGRLLRVDCVPGSPSCSVAVGTEGEVARRRRLPLPSPGRADLVAGELEVTARDRSFEAAVAAAARLIAA